MQLSVKTRHHWFFIESYGTTECHKDTTKVLLSSVLFTIKIQKTRVHIYHIYLRYKNEWKTNF